jgi:transposase
MQIGNRFRCYPSPAQAQTLLAWIGCQRFIYNAKVGEDRYFRRFARQSLIHTGAFAPIDQQYSHFKTEQTPWLGDVPSQILRNGAVLWKQAYGRYFSKLAGRHTTHRKTGQQSVWITSELFTFKPVVDKDTGEISSHTLHIGTPKFPLGQIKLTTHILASTWGKTKEFLGYKARKSGKLAIEVPAFYSSQECAACGHIHSDNRVSQAEFVCQRCNHTGHADHNAAAIIAKSGVRLVLSGACVQKKSKKCGFLKNKVGEVISEPVASVPSTLGETEVSRLGGNIPAHWSLTQETPATATA